MKTRIISISLLFLFFFSQLTFAMVGDLNSDEQVTSVDALIALKMAVGKIPVNLTADMDNDGEVTSLDAYKILLRSLNKEDDLFLQLNRIVKTYDVGAYLTDERMDWVVTQENGAKITIGVVIEKGKLVEFQQGAIKDPSVNVYASEKTVKHLLETQDANEFKNAMKNGDIQLEGVGFINWIKFSVTGFFAGF